MMCMNVIFIELGYFVIIIIIIIIITHRSHNISNVEPPEVEQMYNGTSLISLKEGIVMYLTSDDTLFAP